MRLLEPIICIPTTFYAIKDGLVHSYAGNQAKTTGGDEFFVHNDKFSSIGYVTDLMNGSYAVTMSRDYDEFTIVPQYTCGDGTLAPPLKENWTDSGSLDSRVLFHFNSKPFKVQRMTVDVKPTVIRKKTTYAAGDSMMEQFIGYRMKRKTKRQFYKIQAPLSSKTLDSVFVVPITNMMKPSVKQKTSTLILNSGVWDILESGKEQEDPDFVDHIESLDTLLRHVSTTYPKTQIVWKSMTALHVHKCDHRYAPQCTPRAKYMSSSRAKKLHMLQMELLRTDYPQIIVLDMYNITFENPHGCNNNDGRHYTKKFNNALYKRFIKAKR